MLKLSGSNNCSLSFLRLFIGILGSSLWRDRRNYGKEYYLGIGSEHAVEEYNSRIFELKGYMEAKYVRNIGLIIPKIAFLSSSLDSKYIFFNVFTLMLDLWSLVNLPSPNNGPTTDCFSNDVEDGRSGLGNDISF